MLFDTDARHRWIFIIEGIMTVLVGFMGYCLLVPFPDAQPEKSWNFLNKREIAFIVARVNADRADVVTEPFNLIKFLKPGLDLKVWGFAMCFCCLTTVSYALAYFLPIILMSGMGFSVGASQCLVAPPCESDQLLARDRSPLTNSQTLLPVFACTPQHGQRTNTASVDPSSWAMRW
jgi:hypothetical protein